MKITKRQLRRIIKEEKQKLLRESVSDMRHYEEGADQAAINISDLFYKDMMDLFHEEPEAFEGRSDQAGWEEQVVYAQQELDTGIAHAILEVIRKVEMQLHDGQYHRGN